ncbi:hypothetical protein HK105_201502 [Polyrhizophydium stewartii]|uniref:Mediator of RNA polymerase II transcription subunit 4 n=1 Tax=Polyrhizophydium stewartii TaxID=2732419 RepID=A0ABR4NGM1_9FUNG|nr:hypothetical protein HK105_000818 [Polyrhizophydium stewartii]
MSASPAATAAELYPAYAGLVGELFAALAGPLPEPGTTPAAAKGPSTPGDPLSILEIIKHLDTRLLAFRESVTAHQQLVRQVEATKRELDAHNMAELAFVKRLHKAQDELDAVLADARRKRATMHQAEKGAIDFKELLAYAHRVSKYTMSPVNAETWVIEPPIPQDNQMRMSLLFRQDQLFGPKLQQESAPEVPETAMELDLLVHEPEQQTRQDGVQAEALLDLDFE